jgi:hypothetical protein
MGLFAIKDILSMPIVHWLHQSLLHLEFHSSVAWSKKHKMLFCPNLPGAVREGKRMF